MSFWFPLSLIILLSKSIIGRQPWSWSTGEHGPQMPEWPVYVKRHFLWHVIKYPIESERPHMATHARKDRFTNTSAPTASFKFQIAIQPKDWSVYVTPDLSSDKIQSQDLHIALTLHKIHKREQDIISWPWHLALRQNKKELRMPNMREYNNTKTTPECQQETLYTYKIRILRPRKFTRSASHSPL